MQPHQDRAIKEREELAEKCERLNDFMYSSPVFPALPVDEQRRLTRQYAYMRLYLEVLGERIAAFPAGQ